MLRAMESRNYRLFFAGQLTSLTGTWMAQIAMSWLAYDMTGSRLLLGTVAFASQIPNFLIGPWAGVLIDRWNLRRLLLTTQFLSMLQALTVAALVWTSAITPSLIVVLALILGIINAFDMPGRQSFVVHIVGKRENLPNAIALNSTMFNASRLIGPAIAGIVLAWLGPTVCFLINGISFAGVILALLAIKVAARTPTPRGSVLDEFTEGVRYVSRSLPIRRLLLHVALLSLLGTPYTVLLPAIAQDVLLGGPRTLGMLTSSIGCGALLAAIYLANRKSVVGLGRVIATGALLMGAALIGFAFSHQLWLSIPLLIVAGFAFLSQMASCNTMLQTLVDDDKRGRVMALHGMAFQGMMPLGSLMAGTLAGDARLGLHWTIATCGGACLLAGILFLRSLPALRRQVTPIYRAKGILRPVASGLQAADRVITEKSVSG
jgi:MFS family permease